MLIRKSLAFLLAVVLPLSINADVLEVKEGHPEQYVVVKGDTLWDISSRFLRDPFKWPHVWEENQQIKDPFLIYPGDVISLAYDEVGNPVDLAVKRGSREMKLSPRVRVMSLSTEPVSVIPVSEIEYLLTRTRVVTKDMLNKAPYVAASTDSRVISGRGDVVYGRGASPSKGDSFAVVRVEQEYSSGGDKKGSSGNGFDWSKLAFWKKNAGIQPVKNKAGSVIGIRAVVRGNATVTSAGDPFSLKVTRSNQEIMPGDILLPIEPLADFRRIRLSRPERGIKGHVIDVLDGINQAASYQAVILDLGFADGVSPGTVLTTYKSGLNADDRFSSSNGHNLDKSFVLPDVEVASAVIFKSGEHISYALIITSQEPVHVGDSVGYGL